MSMAALKITPTGLQAIREASESLPTYFYGRALDAMIADPELRKMEVGNFATAAYIVDQLAENDINAVATESDRETWFVDVNRNGVEADVLLEIAREERLTAVRGAVARGYDV